MQERAQRTASQNSDSSHSQAGSGSSLQLSPQVDAGSSSQLSHRSMQECGCSPQLFCRSPHRNPVAPPIGRHLSASVDEHRHLFQNPPHKRVRHLSLEWSEIVNFARGVAHGRIAFASETKNKLGSHPRIKRLSYQGWEWYWVRQYSSAMVMQSMFTKCYLRIFRYWSHVGATHFCV